MLVWLGPFRAARKGIPQSRGRRRQWQHCKACFAWYFHFYLDLLCPGEAVVLHRGSVFCGSVLTLLPGNELLVEARNLIVERRLNLAQVLLGGLFCGPRVSCTGALPLLRQPTTLNSGRGFKPYEVGIIVLPS